jgi:catechol 2,3-dioxygenase-like lactoylglutathione lyase family enzyme
MSDLITGVDFTIIPTDDFDTSVSFYEETLGLPRLKQWGNRHGMEFQAGNLTVAVMEMKDFGQPFKPNGGPIAFQVDDVAAARERLEAAGVEFRADTLDSGVCHQAFFRDPDGNPLIIHHRYAPATPPAA